METSVSDPIISNISYQEPATLALDQYEGTLNLTVNYVQGDCTAFRTEVLGPGDKLITKSVAVSSHSLAGYHVPAGAWVRVMPWDQSKNQEDRRCKMDASYSYSVEYEEPSSN